MTDLTVVALAVAGLGAAVGVWMDAVFSRGPAPLDRVFLPVERAVYALLGVDPDAPMGHRAWTRAVLASNAALGVALCAIFLLQGVLPLDPDGVGGMPWHTALHTAASFLTNTNQQHYAGQSELSHGAQLFAVTAAQVVTPAVGLAVMVAVVRGLAGDTPRADTSGDRDLGNYWSDVVRGCTRVLLPLATALALLLAWQGVPSAFAPASVATTLEGAQQVIPLGPVAPMVAIKQLGTNGGGWYGPNSSFPLENPTPLTNVAQLVAILLVPVGCAVFASRRLGAPMGRLTLGVMALVAVGAVGAIVALESGPNPAFDGLAADGPNWEGKEVRFGVTTSAAWAALTTLTSNGSVNAMHDSLLPLSSLVPFAGMFVNAAFGGVGVGFLNFLLYVALGVFVAGLLVGRAPELLQRKLEAREMRLVVVALLLPSAMTLLPTACTLALGLDGAPQSGAHGLSRVLYEYASAAANNGSGMEGLADATPWWNLSTAAVVLSCRYVPMLAPLTVAGLLAAKRRAPVTSGTLPLGSPATAVTVVAVMFVLQLLTFVPALVLGPVAEHLAR